MYKHLTSSNFIAFVNAYPEHLHNKNRHFVAAAFLAKVFGVKVAQVAISSEMFSCKSKHIGQSTLPAWLVNFMQKDGLFQCPNALASKPYKMTEKEIAKGVAYHEHHEHIASIMKDDTISSKELSVLETQAKELVLPNIA